MEISINNIFNIDRTSKNDFFKVYCINKEYWRESHTKLSKIALKNNSIKKFLTVEEYQKASIILKKYNFAFLDTNRIISQFKTEPTNECIELNLIKIYYEFKRIGIFKKDISIYDAEKYKSVINKLKGVFYPNLFLISNKSELI